MSGARRSLIVERDEGYSFGSVGVRPVSYTMQAVCDTGCGMGLETQALIFEPFLTTEEQGTVLGLSTACGIVKAHPTVRLSLP